MITYFEGDYNGHNIQEGMFRKDSDWELENGKITNNIIDEIEYVEPEFIMPGPERKPRNSPIMDMLTKNGFENNFGALLILQILEEEYNKIKKLEGTVSEIKFPTT